MRPDMFVGTSGFGRTAAPPATLQGLSRALECFAGIDPEYHLSTLRLFTWVCEHPGATYDDIVRDLGLTKAAVSRNVRALGRWEGPDGEIIGPDLIFTTPNPRNRKALGCWLTDNGKALKNDLVKALG